MPILDLHRDILPLRDMLYRLALSITSDNAEAEDVVQETMIRVWTHRDEWTQIRSIEAYCIAVAKRLAIDRSELKESRHEPLDLTEGTQPADPDADPHNGLARRQQLAIVRKLMAQLPERQRQVMHLRDVEGRSYREIAQALSISEDQVKVCLHRARQKVKQKLQAIEAFGLTTHKKP